MSADAANEDAAGSRVASTPGSSHDASVPGESAVLEEAEAALCAVVFLPPRRMRARNRWLRLLFRRTAWRAGEDAAFAPRSKRSCGGAPGLTEPEREEHAGRSEGMLASEREGGSLLPEAPQACGIEGERGETSREASGTGTERSAGGLQKVARGVLDEDQGEG